MLKNLLLTNHTLFILAQGPITLSPPRTTVKDPKLPPIPTFSPKELRKQRIQGHRLRAKILPSNSKSNQQNFPSFPTVSNEPLTRFPPKGRPEPEDKNDIMSKIPVDPAPTSVDGRKPRVKSNLKLLTNKKNKFKQKLNSSKSDFARRFLRNRSRFGKTSKFNQITTTEKPNSESAETTTITETSGGLFSTTEKSRLSFADLFAETHETEVKPDGRKPRVKSNIKQRLANNGRPLESHKIPIPSDLFEPKTQSKRRISADQSAENSVNLDQINEVKAKLLQKQNNAGAAYLASLTNGTKNDDENSVKLLKTKEDILSMLKSVKSGKINQSSDDGPVVRPDGQKPRVKSNILAAKKDNAAKLKKEILAQLKNGKIDPFKINQSSDHEPVVRPDGREPKVKSNILAAGKNNSPGGSKNGNFRHSKKVESAEFVFEPTTLRPLTTTESGEITTVFTETPLESTTPIETTTFPTQTATTIEPETVAFSTSTVSTSLLDFFLSTQVLNTRAVDPTLASIHEKMKEEVIQQNQRKRRKTSPSKKKDLSQEDRKNSV